MAKRAKSGSSDRQSRTSGAAFRAEGNPALLEDPDQTSEFVDILPTAEAQRHAGGPMMGSPRFGIEGAPRVNPDPCRKWRALEEAGTPFGIAVAAILRKPPPCAG